MRRHIGRYRENAKCLADAIIARGLSHLFRNQRSRCPNRVHDVRLIADAGEAIDRKPAQADEAQQQEPIGGAHPAFERTHHGFFGSRTGLSNIALMQRSASMRQTSLDPIASNKEKIFPNQKPSYSATI